MSRRTKSENSGALEFGGPWTDKKLEVLAGYLRFYTTALKNQSFSLLYIDGFAGAGYRDPAAPKVVPQQGGFEFAAGQEGRPAAQGSASIALATAPPFDQLVFIEQDKHRCESLKALATHAGRNNATRVIEGDANQEIARICREIDWRSSRAVVLLDPFGMQVEWPTLKAIAETRAVDLWLLLPVGVAVNRMLTRSGEITKPWRARLTKFFGCEDWQTALYQAKSSHGLFGNEETFTKATVEQIGEYFLSRLKTIFAEVSPQPVVLHNTQRSTLFWLCFAIANPSRKAIDLALKVAADLAKEE